MVTLSRKHLPLACLLALGAAFFCGQELHAQVPTVKGKGNVISTFEQTFVVLSNTTPTVYTVPAGRRLVITDVIISNVSDTESVRVAMDRGGTGVFAMELLPTRVFNHAFTTGPGYAAGQSIVLGTGSQSSPTIWYL